eukprot:g12990.t1
MAGGRRVPAAAASACFNSLAARLSLLATTTTPSSVYFAAAWEFDFRLPLPASCPSANEHILEDDSGKYCRTTLLECQCREELLKTYQKEICGPFTQDLSLLTKETSGSCVAKIQLATEKKQTCIAKNEEAARLTRKSKMNDVLREAGKIAGHASPSNVVGAALLPGVHHLVKQDRPELKQKTRRRGGAVLGGLLQSAASKSVAAAGDADAPTIPQETPVLFAETELSGIETDATEFGELCDGADLREMCTKEQRSALCSAGHCGRRIGRLRLDVDRVERALELFKIVKQRADSFVCA